MTWELRCNPCGSVTVKMVDDTVQRGRGRCHKTGWLLDGNKRGQKGNALKLGSRTSLCWEPPRGLLKHTLLGPTPRVSVSVGLGWGQEIYVSHKFSGWGITFSEPPFWSIWDSDRAELVGCGRKSSLHKIGWGRRKQRYQRRIAFLVSSQEISGKIIHQSDWGGKELYSRG